MKVIGIGDNVVDQYEHVRTQYPGGNALNFAAFARLMGYGAAYLGIFGTDAAADHVRSVLDQLAVDTSRCRQVAGENGFARLKNLDGERVFLASNAGGIRKTASMAFIFDDVAYLREFALIHTGSYSYMDPQLPALRRLNIPLSYDFSDDFEPAQALDLCGYLDFAFFSCAGHSLAQTREMMQAAAERGCGMVIATRGQEGAVLFNGRQWFHQQPYYVTPVDTLGAGDAFIAAFLLAYLTGDGEDADDLIRASLDTAATYAAQACLSEGAFGYGAPY